MDAGEAGREHLERWPRDRVILGSLYPYRPAPSPAAWLRGLVGQRGPQISPGALLISNNGHRSALFGPVCILKCSSPSWLVIVQGSPRSGKHN
jgi:hypothetical protein